MHLCLSSAGICKSSYVFLDLSHSAILYQSATFLQETLFYSLTSYFHLSIDCLNIFVLPRSCITQISLFLKKNKEFFFPVIVFSCPVWRSCREILHITSLMWCFWEKNSAWRVSHITQSPTSIAARVKGQVAFERTQAHRRQLATAVLLTHWSSPWQTKAEGPEILLKRELQLNYAIKHVHQNKRHRSSPHR